MIVTVIAKAIGGAFDVANMAIAPGIQKDKAVNDSRMFHLWERPAINEAKPISQSNTVLYIILFIALIIFLIMIFKRP